MPQGCESEIQKLHSRWALKNLVVVRSNRVTDEQHQDRKDDSESLGIDIHRSRLRDFERPWGKRSSGALKWLPTVQHVGLEDSIVRDISVPGIGSRATSLLIEGFRKSAAGARPGSVLPSRIGHFQTDLP
jgi:hypothetical protein